MHQKIIKLLSFADIISMLNALFGFLAIMVLYFSFTDQALLYRLSFSFIFLGILADGLDGFIARKTKKGQLGPYFESMADFTTTGLATSIFVFSISMRKIDGSSSLYLIIIALLIVFYLLCNLTRLAAFHPLNTVDHYQGLPAPAASIIIILGAYLGFSYMVLFPLILIISILMVSPLTYMKPTIQMNIGIACLIIIILIVGPLWDAVFFWILFIFMALYVIISPIQTMRQKK